MTSLKEARVLAGGWPGMARDDGGLDPPSGHGLADDTRVVLLVGAWVMTVVYKNLQSDSAVAVDGVGLQPP